MLCVERYGENDTGDTFSTDEVCVYKTAEGKIVANIPIEVFLTSKTLFKVCYNCYNK